MAGTILDPVKVATNVNISNIATKNWSLGVELIDNTVDLVVGDRVLVKAQTFPTENGIYVFTNVVVGGITYVRLVRSTDFAAGATIQPNTVVFVQRGEIHADTGWLVANNGASLVNFTEIEFKRFTINLALGGIDLPSSIVLRKENGRPLTNDQLDGNFKYLYDSLVSKLDVSAFNPKSVTDKIKELTAEEANLDVWKLRGLAPTPQNIPTTVAARDQDGSIFSTLFVGDLQGNAATADLADFATLAGNVTGVVGVVHGGTGADNPDDARDNLAAVSRNGDTITGTLNLYAPQQTVAAAAINIGVGDPVYKTNGDIWANSITVGGQIVDYRLFYQFNSVVRSIAHIESPNFEGTPTTPNVDKTTNNTIIANTKFVQDHVTDINVALALKAPLASPALTGIPTAPTAGIATENTQIATTAYVKNKVNDKLNAYDTSNQVTAKVSALSNTLTPLIDTAQETADEALKRSGLPVGSINYVASQTVPLGWLKADGALVSTTLYPDLFAAIGYTYGGSGNLFRLPDLRGEFVRGWDNGRGVDSNRAFGSTQKGSLVGYDELYDYVWNLSTTTDGISSNEAVGVDRFVKADYPDARLTGTASSSSNTLTTNSFGSGFVGVTRPRNVAMLAIIKAFGVPDNIDAISLSNAIQEINGRVRLNGDVMTGFLTLHANPTQSLHAATKQYVDTTVANADMPSKVAKSGDTMTGFLTLHAAPTANMHASTKKYVDDLYNDLRDNSGTPVGAIAYYPVATLPFGWLMCDGSLVSTTQYAKLFSIIGYTYGGSGSVFRLPDLRGEFIRGWDNGRGVDVNRALGSFQGGSLHVHNEDNDGFTGGIWQNMHFGDLSERLGYDKVTQQYLKSTIDGIDLAYPVRGGVYSDWVDALDASRWTYMSRPRNVAMVACIKAFGSIDDADQVAAQEVINSIAGKVSKLGDSMSGFLTLHANPTQNLHAATKQYVDTAVANVSLLPGPPGPQGVAGPTGPTGPQGPAGAQYTFTYGYTQTVDFTNSVGSYSDRNYFDVFPPSGKTMANIVAFIPSIRTIHYAGGVDGNDSLRCEYVMYSDRIRVWVQNTEQRWYPSANWLAIWS